MNRQTGDGGNFFPSSVFTFFAVVSLLASFIFFAHATSDQNFVSLFAGATLHVSAWVCACGSVLSKILDELRRRP